MSIQLDLRPGDGRGIPLTTFALLAKIISAVDPTASVSNVAGGYRITLPEEIAVDGLSERLREVADELDADDDDWGDEESE